MLRLYYNNRFKQDPIAMPKPTPVWNTTASTLSVTCFVPAEISGILVFVCWYYKLCDVMSWHSVLYHFQVIEKL